MNMFLRFQLVLALAVSLCSHNAMTVAIATCADHFGEDVCHYPLHWAALSGDVKGTMAAIQMGKYINEKIPGYGTPLHQAAFYGRSTVVKLLLQHGADVAVTDLDGDTPIKTTDMKWCSQYPNDRTCQMKPSNYRETIHWLTAGCKTVGCSGQLWCLDNKCANLCNSVWCGVNAVCTVHDDRAMCQCKGDKYSGDPYVMCLEMGEVKYIYKAYLFVRDVVIEFTSAVVKDVKSFMKNVQYNNDVQ